MQHAPVITLSPVHAADSVTCTHKTPHCTCYTQWLLTSLLSRLFQEGPYLHKETSRSIAAGFCKPYALPAAKSVVSKHQNEPQSTDIIRQCQSAGWAKKIKQLWLALLLQQSKINKQVSLKCSQSLKVRLQFLCSC